MGVNDDQEYLVDAAELYYDPFVIKRVVKCRINYAVNTPYMRKLKEGGLGFKAISFSRVKNEEKKAKKDKIKELENIAMGNAENKMLLELFCEYFKKLTTEEFKFQKARLVTSSDSNYAVKSDGKRLIGVFDIIKKKTTNKTIMSRVLIELMDAWFAWDKASARNIVGFLEAQAREDLATIFMRVNKGTVSAGKNGRSVVLSEKRRVEVTDKQRSLFKGNAA